MIKRAGIWLLAFLFLGSQGLSGAPGKKRPMTIRDVLQIRSVFDTQLSPDGKWILFGVRQVNLKKNRFNTDIWMIRSTGGDPIRLTYSLASERNWRWSPDGGKIAFISRRNKHAQIYLLSMEGGEAEQLTEFESDIRAFRWSPDGGKIAFLAQEPLKPEEKKKRERKDDARVVDRDFRYTHLWVIDVNTKEVKQLTRGQMQVDNFDWSPDGKKIVFSHRPTPRVPDHFNADLSIVTLKTGKIEQLVSRPGYDTNPLFSPNGKAVAFLSQDGDTTWYSNSYICVIDLKKRKIRNVTRQFDNPIQDYRWADNGKAFVFVGGERTNMHLWRISARGGRPRKLTAQFPGVNSSFSLSADGRLLSFIHHDGKTPPDVYLTDARKFAPRKLTTLHTYLDSFQLAYPEIIRWKGRDGMVIEGLLFKPLHYKTGQRVPLITVVHGGPAGYYLNAFYSGYVYPYQVFAAKGYAVLLPNPRGSGNYGYAFRKANFKDWGGEDYWDIMRGVDSVIDMGVAHPDSLAIMGWSYGGYMTSWIITQTDRFKAASVGAGVTNLYSFTGQTDIPEFMKSYWGVWPWDDPQLYQGRSAVYHIQNVKTPTLIQHGEADARVPIAQGRELYIGLKKMGVPVKFVIYPRQPHGIREPRLLMDAMRRNLEWVERWLRGREAEGKAK
jgi:dipeptidyl aminopeptidase/acylaminoacyl peptidase